MRPAVRIGLAVGVLAVFAGLVARTSFLIDDAFISFRYAALWAETGVPTFDRFAPPVEGYSNFLWVVVLRLAAELGLALEVASRVLSVALAVATLALVWRFLERLPGLPARSGPLGALLLATLPPFAVWSTGGLESALHGFLLTGAACVVLGPRGGHERRAALGAALLGAGLVLVRVEGLAWALGVAAVGAVAARRGAAGARRVVALAAGSVAAAAAFFLWRHATYGAWLANTAHAKGGLSPEVLARGARTVASYGVLFVTPVVALAAPLLAPRRARAVALALGAVLVGALAFNVAVGGDWMPFFRLLAPASGAVAILAALGLARLPARAAWGTGVALAALQVLPVLDAHLVPRGVREALYFRTFRVGYQTEWERWERGEENRLAFTALGRALARVVEPTDSLTLGPIGAIGYYSGMRLFDRNGLVDPEVARRDVELGEGTAGHERRVPRAWFLPREPTFFEARLWPSLPGGAPWPGPGPAIASVGRYLASEPGEEPLFEHSVAEVHALEPDAHLPEGARLVLVRRVDDRAVARAFWGPFGL